MFDAGTSPERIAAELSVSRRTLYRWLARAGGGGVQGRRRRSDAGQAGRAISPEAWQQLVSLTCHDRLAADEAIRVLVANGLLAEGQISASWINARRRDLAITARDLKRTGPRVTVRREASRPNAEHQADATPAASIYLDTRGDYWYEPDSPLHKVHHHAGKTRVHVFGIVDKFSRSAYLRPYNGETTRNWLDFFYRAWSPKTDPGLLPFCGLPGRLRCDSNPGRTRAVVRALAEIGVRVIPHEPGQAWKKGAIEAMLRTYQQRMEPALRHQRIGSFADLCVFLERASLYHGNRVHSATGEAPFERWRRIDPAKLILPPVAEDWVRLCLMEDECRVDGHMTIHFGPPDAREAVELPFEKPWLNYAGHKVRVFYAPGSSDPILVRLQPMAGFAGGEFRAERVRPGARPASQSLSNLTTEGEELLRATRDLESGLDLTRHWEGTFRRWEPVQAGGRAVIDASTLFAREYDWLDAVLHCQAEGVFAETVTEGDKSALDDLFAAHGGREGRVMMDDLSKFCAELRRVKESRQVPG